jgi:DNA-binding IclR family transcriptional regulator
MSNEVSQSRTAQVRVTTATDAAPAPTATSSSVTKALRILSLFTPERPEWGASEVAAELGVTVPTAHRMLTVLATNGFLARFGRGRFRLGLEAISLGRRALASIDLRSILRSDLQQIAASTGETALLTIHDERRRASLCIDRFESHHPLRLSVDVGRLTPLHAGASAKALLAYLRPADVDDVMSRPLDRLAQGTITDPEVLRAELNDIRERGYATSTEETDVAAWGVAAAIRATDGTAIAAIGLAGPTHRLNTEVSRRCGQLVMDIARDAERRLGGLEASLHGTPR